MSNSRVSYSLLCIHSYFLKVAAEEIAAHEGNHVDEKPAEETPKEVAEAPAAEEAASADAKEEKPKARLISFFLKTKKLTYFIILMQIIFG